MSMLSSAFKKLGKGAKKLVTNPGKWAENVGRSVGATAKTVAPVLSIVPGVGPIAAGAIGALGNVAAGGNMKQTLGTGLKTAALGSALSAIPGGSSVGSKLGSGLSKVPGMNSLAGFAKSIPGASTFLPSSATPATLPTDPAAWGGNAGVRIGQDGLLQAIPGATVSAAAPATQAAQGGLANAVKGALSGTLKAAKDNPLVTAQIASGVLQARQQGAQTALQREQMEYERRRQEDQQARLSTNASAFAPLFQSALSRSRSPWASYQAYNPYGAS